MSVKSFRWRGLTVCLILIAVFLGLLFGLLRQNSVVASVSDLNLRTGPGLTYRTTTQVKKNSRLTILNRKDNWYHVRDSQNHFGWVASWLVGPNATVKKATNLSEATIVLDAGHGGSDSGALTANHKHDEKTYTLKMVQATAKQLRAAGARVVLTRDTDQYVGLAARPQLADDLNADAFISFHFDSSPTNNSASGHTTYYYHKKTSMALATDISDQLTNVGLSNRGIKFGNFEVIRDNSRPAILLEMGYINNKHDFKSIEDPEYQRLVAKDVTAGLKHYFNE
ncbi:N-acetylmuramoyl-L-alanine amidase [Levilactobacillus bambusae]|uniref:N-acetylmuramoyl-L-alanine amidase n=1 Tax=Levilactobacillus bambusae TaxID=2024736 RepID=A0A2V1N0I5_9LACO|nr:N-acetylmuramoyl-L-alanine amidase [Levilactobacillus bambusae]PWG00759.1 N-acetylmuramoyl-L-alanine amidase [Levilactobacillus bambusae]